MCEGVSRRNKSSCSISNNTKMRHVNLFKDKYLYTLPTFVLVRGGVIEVLDAVCDYINMNDCSTTYMYIPTLSPSPSLLNRPQPNC